MIRVIDVDDGAWHPARKAGGLRQQRILISPSRLAGGGDNPTYLRNYSDSVSFASVFVFDRHAQV